MPGGGVDKNARMGSWEAPMQKLTHKCENNIRRKKKKIPRFRTSARTEY
jgi:hypothetical protein